MAAGAADYLTKPIRVRELLQTVDDVLGEPSSALGGAVIGATPQGGARILLVEDDTLNRALVRAVLARCADPELQGVCLVEAGDLAQARAALAGAPVDVVLLDLGLPDGSGLELAAELRNAHDGGLPPCWPSPVSRPQLRPARRWRPDAVRC